MFPDDDLDFASLDDPSDDVRPAGVSGLSTEAERWVEHHAVRIATGYAYRLGRVVRAGTVWDDLTDLSDCPSGVTVGHVRDALNTQRATLNHIAATERAARSR